MIVRTLATDDLVSVAAEIMLPVADTGVGGVARAGTGAYVEINGNAFRVSVNALLDAAILRSSRERSVGTRVLGSV